MKRVNQIYLHPVFQKKYIALQEAEKDRMFCKHTLEHFIDVARLMYIYSLEHQLPISKDVIYGMALMHDIGRIDQIEKGIPHEKAGAALCDAILPDCGFTKEETALIGDRLYTDIACGVNAGIDTVFVLSGECTMEDLKTSEVQPAYILENIAVLLEELK